MNGRIPTWAIGGALPLLALAATAASAQTPLSPGVAQTGAITTESATMTENLYFLDLYRISGAAGDRFAITMESDAFDSYLEVGRMTDGRFEQLAANDDGGDGVNSRLVFTLPQAGDYVVRARTFGAGDTGAYRIVADRLPPPPPPPPPSPIAAGQTVTGSLTADSPVYEVENYGDSGVGRHYALYSLRGRAGQSVTVTLHSNDFDSFLEVGAMTPVGFGIVKSNDDGVPMADAGYGEDMHDGMDMQEGIDMPLGGMSGLDSRLTVTFAQAGTMIIRATTLGEGATGSYSLSVE